MTKKSSASTEHIEYHKGGSVRAKGPKANGELDGYWEWFRTDGTLLRSGYFQLGEQVGKWTTYDKSGQVYKVTEMQPRSATAARKEPKQAAKKAVKKLSSPKAAAKSKEPKTRPTAQSVEDFLVTVDPKKVEGSRLLIAMMEELTGEPATMWGPSMIGFGKMHYKYESGHEGDTFLTGFSPRKATYSLYLTCDLEKHADNLTRLGKHKTGKGCLYITRLEDVNLDVLREMIQQGVKEAHRLCPQ